MFIISPGIKESISNICKDPSIKIILEIPGIDLELVQEFLERTLNFIRENYSDIGDKDFVLRLDFNSNIDNAVPLSTNTILNSISHSTEIIYVDNKLKVIQFGSIDNLSQTSLSQYSHTNKCCIFHIHSQNFYTIYALGITIHENNALLPSRGPTTKKKTARDPIDYKQSLIDHYQNRLRFGNTISSHWEDRKKRILRNSPKKTEQMFHDNLQNWLVENLNGAIVTGNVNKDTSDETDIEIRSLMTGEFFIIEVKWLGTNGPTNYSESKLRDAIIQVRNYLDREPTANEACLAVYDGRDLSKFNSLNEIDSQKNQWKEIESCQDEILPARGKGFVFYLENKTASQK